MTFTVHHLHIKQENSTSEADPRDHLAVRRSSLHHNHGMEFAEHGDKQGIFEVVGKELGFSIFHEYALKLFHIPY